MRLAHLLLVLNLLPACYSEADPPETEVVDGGAFDIPPHETIEEPQTDTLEGDPFNDGYVTQGDPEYTAALSFCDDRVKLRLHATLDKYGLVISSLG